MCLGLAARCEGSSWGSGFHCELSRACGGHWPWLGVGAWAFSSALLGLGRLPALLSPWYRSSSLSCVWSAGLAVPSPQGPAHLVYCVASGHGDGRATSFLGSHLVGITSLRSYNQEDI